MGRAATSIGWFLWVAVAACGTPPPAEPAPSSTDEPAPASTGDKLNAAVSSEALCQAYCDRWEGCGKPRAQCTCQANGKDLSVFNASYLGRLMLCLDGVPCSSLDAGSAWAACHDTTVDGLTTSKKLRSFCFDSSKRAAACGNPNQADQSSCLVTFRHVSDAAIDEANACLQQDCAEVPNCVRWALSPK